MSFSDFLILPGFIDFTSDEVVSTETSSSEGTKVPWKVCCFRRLLHLAVIFSVSLAHTQSSVVINVRRGSAGRRDRSWRRHLLFFKPSQGETNPSTPDSGSFCIIAAFFIFILFTNAVLFFFRAPSASFLLSLARTAIFARTWSTPTGCSLTRMFTLCLCWREGGGGGCSSTSRQMTGDLIPGL